MKKLWNVKWILVLCLLTGCGESERAAQIMPLEESITASASMDSSKGKISPQHNSYGENSFVGVNMTNDGTVCPSGYQGFYKTLEEIEKMPADIKSLSLSQININDMDALAKYTNLEELEMNDCQINGHAIDNLDFLKKLKNLKRLSLNDCGIADLSMFRNFSDLEELQLNYNIITDISPLSELSKIKRLGLMGNDVSDISPLQTMTALEELLLVSGNDKINSLEPLYGLENLNHIMVSKQTYDNLLEEDKKTLGNILEIDS